MLCHRCGKILYEGVVSCPVCGLDLAGGKRGGSAAAAEAATVSVPGYAGFWRRAAALLIDKFLLGSVNLGLSLVFMVSSGLGDGDDGLRTLFLASAMFGFLLHWLYFTLMESSALRATLGKAAIGIVVTDYAGARVSWLRANGRYWAKIVSALPLYLGYVMAGFTARKQALHDLIAGTLVVRK